MEFEQRQTVFQSDQYLQLITEFKTKLTDAKTLGSLFKGLDGETVLGYFELVHEKFKASRIANKNGKYSLQDLSVLRLIAAKHIPDSFANSRAF